MAQWVKGLLLKHEGLIFIPRTHRRSQSRRGGTRIYLQSWGHRDRRMITMAVWLVNQSRQNSKFQANERCCLTNKMDYSQKYTLGCKGWMEDKYQIIRHRPFTSFC